MTQTRKRNISSERTEEAGSPKKKCSIFSASDFRSQLHGTGGISVLRRFVQLGSEEDVVLEYFKTGGTCEEMVGLLTDSNKDNLSEVSVVLSALELIFIKVQRDAPHYTYLCEQAANHLLLNFSSLFLNLLSSDPAYKKVCLKFLTATVTLNTHLAKSVLQNVHITYRTMQKLAVTTKSNVRTSFIHFILSFLMEEDITVIRQFLERRELLMSIFPGLLHDKSETVQLVLVTLRCKLLENVSIHKATKLRIFNISVVKSFLTLNDWQGPQKSSKRRADRKKKQITVVPPDEGQLRAVREALHDMLVVLCTSPKCGIIFRDKVHGYSGRQSKQVILSVLQSVKKPWEDEYMEDLVLQVLCAHPEYVHQTLLSLEPYLEPRISSKWFEVVNFVQSIVEKLDASKSLTFSEVSKPKQLMTTVANLCAPTCILNPIKRSNLYKLEPTVLSRILKLLCGLLQKLQVFTNTIVELKLLSAGEIVLFRRLTSQYLVQNIPKVDTLVQILQNDKLLGNDISGKGQVLDLLMHYYYWCPDMVESVPSCDPTFLLLQAQHLEGDKQAVGALQIKVLQLFLSIGNVANLTENVILADVLLFLVGLYDTADSIELERSCELMLSRLLIGLGMFEDAKEEVSIWVYSLLQTAPENRVDIVNFFLNGIRLQQQNSLNYSVLISEAYADCEMSVGTQGGDSLFAYVMEMENFSENIGVNISQPSSSVSSFSLALLEAVKLSSDEAVPASILKYMSSVLIYLFHTQSFPKPMYKLLLPYLSIFPNSVVQYVEGWVNKGSIFPLKKPFGSQSAENMLNRSILTGEEYDVTDSIRSDLQALLLYQLVLFYITQLAERGELSEQVQGRCKEHLLKLISKMQEIKCENIGLLVRLTKTNDYNVFFQSLRYLFTNSALLKYFSPFRKKEADTELLVTDLIMAVVDRISGYGDEDFVLGLLDPCKQKLMTVLMKQLKKLVKHQHKKHHHFHENVVIQKFKLKIQDVETLLKLLVSLSVEDILDVEQGQITGWGKLMAELLRKAVDVRPGGNCESLPAEVVRNLVRVLTAINNVNTCDVDIVGEAVLQYLKRFPHHLGVIDDDLFLDMLRSCCLSTQFDSFVKLIQFLLSSSDSFRISFREWFMNSNNSSIVEEKMEVFFPLLVQAWNNDDKFQKYVYDLYGKQIQRTLLKPGLPNFHWMNENSNRRVCSVLINKHMDVTICEKICSKWKKYADSLSVSQLELVCDIVCKLEKTNYQEEEGSSLINFVSCLLTVIVTRLENDDRTNLPELFSVLDNSFNNVQCVESWHLLKKEPIWNKYVMLSLKSGVCLNILAKLCQVVYKTGGESVKDLYDMVISHSEFLTVMSEDSKRREDMLFLMLTLAEKHSKIGSPSHVPVFLGAYHGTLSPSDQYILKLLHVYEKQGIRLSNVLWGEAAVNFYAGMNIINFNLWRQPQMGQIMEIIDAEKIMYTAYNFPLHRELDMSDNLYSTDLYDPAFLLPLFSNLLAPESLVRVYRFIDSGCLSFTFAALSSCSTEIRAAAYHVLGRYYLHLEGLQKQKQHLVWLHLLDLVRNGLLKAESEEKYVQLSCIVTVFLANAVHILYQPLHFMYGALQKFLLAKPTLDLFSVPEFLVLFNSTDVNYIAERHWVLDILRHGLRSELDFKVAMKRLSFKVVMDFYASVLCDYESRLSILKVIDAVVRIPNLGISVIVRLGLITWLEQPIMALENNHVNIACSLIDILSAMGSCLTKQNNPEDAKKQHRNRAKDYVRSYVVHGLYTLLMTMLPRLPRKIPSQYFAEYLNVLRMVCTQYSCKASTSLLLSKDDVVRLVNIARELGTDVDECECMLKYGARFVVQDSEDVMEGKVKNALKNLISVCLNDVEKKM